MVVSKWDGNMVTPLLIFLIIIIVSWLMNQAWTWKPNLPVWSSAHFCHHQKPLTMPEVNELKLVFCLDKRHRGAPLTYQQQTAKWLCQHPEHKYADGPSFCDGNLALMSALLEYLPNLKDNDCLTWTGAVLIVFAVVHLSHQCAIMVVSVTTVSPQKSVIRLCYKNNLKVSSDQK